METQGEVRKSVLVERKIILSYYSKGTIKPYLETGHISFFGINNLASVMFPDLLLLVFKRLSLNNRTRQLDVVITKMSHSATSDIIWGFSVLNNEDFGAIVGMLITDVIYICPVIFFVIQYE